MRPLGRWTVRTGQKDCTLVSTAQVMTKLFFRKWRLTCTYS